LRVFMVREIFCGSRHVDNIIDKVDNKARPVKPLEQGKNKKSNMIPDFQSIMLPLLQQIADGNEHSMSEVINSLAVNFKLSDDDLNEYLPSRNQKTFYNRVFWAKAHLKFAGFLENTRKGHFVITDSGKQALSTKPNIINIKFLRQFPEYVDKTAKGRPNEKSNTTETYNEIEDTSTPDEIFDSTYKKIRKNLAEDLLSKIKLCDPFFFEKLVVNLLEKMGYGEGNITKRSGDEGIDGIIKQDCLGLESIYIQAKRWENVIGSPEIQKFAGALAGQSAKKGVFITTSRFSNEAREYIKRIEAKIVLIDGELLADYMIKYDLAVKTEQTFRIKKIDNDYFEDE